MRVRIAGASGRTAAALGLLAVLSMPPAGAARGDISTVAGGAPVDTSPRLDRVAIAVTPGGDLLVTGSGVISRVNSDHTLTRIAGTGVPGSSGDGGPAVAAQIAPVDLVTDSSGNLYFSEVAGFSGRVRRIDAGGTVTTIAGGGVAFPDGVAATAANLQPIDDMAPSPAGLVIGQPGGIFRVDNAGIIHRLAGNPNRFPGMSGDGGPAVDADVCVSGLTVDAAGNIDFFGHYFGCDSRIRRIDPTGTIATVIPADSRFVGNAILAAPGGGYYIAGFRHVVRVAADGSISDFVGNGYSMYEGQGRSAHDVALGFPASLAVDGAGNLFVGDGNGTNLIWRIDSSAVATVVAGNPILPYPGNGGYATFSTVEHPGGVTPDLDGGFYISEPEQNRLRHVSGLDLPTSHRAGVISTVVPVLHDPQIVLPGQSWDVVHFNHPTALATGPDGAIYVADTGSDRVLRLGSRGDSAFIVAGPTDVKAPLGVAVDRDGNVFIADTGNHRIRRVDKQTGLITTIAGDPLLPALSGAGPAVFTPLQSPSGIAVDGFGTVFFTDRGTRLVQRIDSGFVSTVAGGGSGQVTGQPAATAAFADPVAIVADGIGDLYIADAGTNRVVAIDATGHLVTVGSGTDGFAGDGGPASGAAFSHPQGVAVDRSLSVLVADTGNNRVRRISG